MRPLRLLLTADAVGGVWTYALELARALATHDVETTLAVLGPPPDADQHREAEAVPGLTLAVRSSRLEWQDDPWDDVDRDGAWLLQLARASGADVVQLGGYAHGELPFRLPVVVVAHSCVASWWRAVHQEPEPERYAGYRERVRRGVAAADVLVAPTRAFLRQACSLHGPARRALVIPNGITLGPRPPKRREPFVLAAGRAWDPAKGLDVLDAAAAELPWPTRIAGGLEGAGAAATGPRHATALGRLPRDGLRAWMERAAVFCHPARYEPFGLAPLEAAAAGCALVLSDLPTLRETWDGAARFVRVGDRVDLRDAIRSLAADPDALAELAARARARALSFDVGTQARAYLELYRALLGERAAPSPTTRSHEAVR